MNFHERTASLYAYILLVTCVLFCSCSGHKKVHRVGILSGLGYFAETADGFKFKMNELGYIEGGNILYDEEKTEFDVAAYRKILGKFIADKVDLILAFPTEASMEAKSAAAGTGIPVIFADANIEDTGLVTSIREPGANITGVRFPGPDIALKRLEVMHRLAPKAKRILVPFQKGYPTVKVQLDAMRPYARSNAITLIELPAENVAELKGFLEARVGAKDAGIDAVVLIPEPFAVNAGASKAIFEFTGKRNIPVGGMEGSGYKAAYTVVVNNYNTGKQAALLADKIFNGHAAGSIPVVSSDIHIQINSIAAKKLGLEVSEDLLSAANEVVH